MLPVVNACNVRHSSSSSHTPLNSSMMPRTEASKGIEDRSSSRITRKRPEA
jgi:hypothetical protein